MCLKIMSQIRTKNESSDVQAVIVDNLKKPQFLILKRLNKNSGDYEFRLVKGGIEKTENRRQALAREIKEETGIDNIKIIKRLASYSYSYFIKRNHITHTVVPYLVRVAFRGNSNLIDQANEGGFDIDSLLWMSGKNSLKFLSYAQERGLIKEVLKYLRNNFVNS